MAQTNYNNPSGMDPRGNWDPSGGLAGWNYTDRLRDYKIARDIANESGALANMGTRNQLRDWDQNSENRTLQRQVTGGALGQQITLQPGATNLAITNQQGDIASAEGNNATKVFQAMQSLPEAKRAQQMKETERANIILTGMSETTTTQEALDGLSRAGVDVSRWKDKNPEQVRKELLFIKGIKIADLKQLGEMEKVKFQEAEHNARQDKVSTTQKEVAEIQAGRSSAAGKKVDRDNEMDAEARRIIAKTNSGETTTADEDAYLEVYKIRAGEPFNKAAAAAAGKADQLKRTLDAIKRKAGEAGPSLAVPKHSAPKGGPKLQGPADPSAERYDALSDGEPFTYKGEQFWKGKR